MVLTLSGLRLLQFAIDVNGFCETELLVWHWNGFNTVYPIQPSNRVCSPTNELKLPMYMVTAKKISNRNYPYPTRQLPHGPVRNRHKANAVRKRDIESAPLYISIGDRTRVGGVAYFHCTHYYCIRFMSIPYRPVREWGYKILKPAFWYRGMNVVTNARLRMAFCWYFSFFLLFNFQYIFIK